MQQIMYEMSQNEEEKINQKFAEYQVFHIHKYVSFIVCNGYLNFFLTRFFSFISKFFLVLKYFFVIRW